MLEKNGMLNLTQEEILAIQRGQVPQRLAEEFGQSPARLKELVKSGEYRKDNANHNETNHD